MKRFIAFWLCGLATALALAGSAGAHTLAGNERAARHDAKLLLGRLKLPAGAVRVGKEKLSLPYTDELRIDARWRVSESADEVVAFIEAHRPYRGGQPFTSAEAMNGRVVPYLNIRWPSIRGVLYERDLDIVLTPQPGGTRVQAEASSAWFIPRSAISKALEGAGALTVTRGSSHVLTTSDPVKVRRIVGIFDAVPIFEPSGAVAACYAPYRSDGWTTFTFYATLGGRELARFNLPRGGFRICGPTPVLSIPGQEPVYLFVHPSFLPKAGRILGITLH